MNYAILTSMTNEQANKLDAQNIEGENIQKLTLEMYDIMAEYPSEFIAVKVDQQGAEIGDKFYCTSFDYLANEATSKNGIDLVKYDDGKIGVIGRDNYKDNYYKILREASDIERDNLEPIENLRKEWAEQVEDAKSEARAKLNALEDYSRELDDIKYDIQKLLDEIGEDEANELGLNDLIDTLENASNELYDTAHNYEF